MVMMMLLLSEEVLERGVEDDEDDDLGEGRAVTEGEYLENVLEMKLPDGNLILEIALRNVLSLE